MLMTFASKLYSFYTYVHVKIGMTFLSEENMKVDYFMVILITDNSFSFNFLSVPLNTHYRAPNTQL